MQTDPVLLYLSLWVPVLLTKSSTVKRNEYEDNREPSFLTNRSSFAYWYLALEGAPLAVEQQLIGAVFLS